MAVSKTTVQAVLDKFYQENPGPDAKKARITDADRTWQEQLDWIIARPKSYPNIVKRFLTQYKLKTLPAKQKDLSPEQLTWWETEIMKQAGKSPGFPHVGGKAIDVGVGSLPLDLKVKLYEMLTKEFKVLKEKGSDYQVTDPKQASCFHCYD